MSMLEQLSIRTQGLIVEEKPFESWDGSPVKDWNIKMQMLTIGDLSDIAQLTSTASPIEASYLSKIYLLAKSLLGINNSPIVTEEDIEKYNKEHNLTGNQQIDLFRYKVLFIRQWTEPVVNRLSYMYDEMQDKYLSKHLGKDLSEEMKAASVSGVDLSEVTSPQSEEDSNEVDRSGDVSST